MWGSLRWWLGIAQMALAAAALGAVVTVGLAPVSWAFIVAATVAAAVSRLLYRGRMNPPTPSQRSGTSVGPSPSGRASSGGAG